MRHARIDNDRVGRTIWAEHKTVRRFEPRLRPRGEVLLGCRRQGRVDLDRGDPAGAADDLGKDGAVVAGPGTDMDDMGAIARAETVIHASPEGWLPVVEPLLINRNQHVVIEMARNGSGVWCSRLSCQAGRV